MMAESSPKDRWCRIVNADPELLAPAAPYFKLLQQVVDLKRIVVLSVLVFSCLVARNMGWS